MFLEEPPPLSPAEQKYGTSFLLQDQVKESLFFSGPGGGKIGIVLLTLFSSP